MKASQTDRPLAQAARQQQLRTVVALRLFATLAQLSLLWVAHSMLGVALPWPMLGLIFSLLLVLNATTWLRLRQQQPIGQYELVSQLFADIAAFSLVLYFTGGVTNPFVSLYLPLLGLAAALLPIRQVVVLAVVSVLAYSVLMMEYIPLVLANPADGVYFHLVGMWLNFMVSALILVGFVARLSNALRKRESALSLAQNRLASEERLAALGNQAASIAHQLGTPVSTIATLVADLRDEPRLEDHLQDLNVLASQVQAIQATLQSLREQVHARDAGLNAPAPVDLDAWVGQAVAHWRNRHPAQELFVDSGSRREPAMLDVRAEVLDLALNALLDNAMQAQMRAGVAQPLQIRVHVLPTLVRLELQDQGGGIAPELLPLLGVQPVDGHGQGVGLFLLANLLQREGAALSFANQVDGACVVIDIPRKVQ